MLTLLLAITLAASVAAEQSVDITVHDALGGAIAGASIDVAAGDSDAQAVTGTDGRATVTIASGAPVVVSARADGFTPLRRRFSAPAEGATLRMVLEPAPLDLSVTVTAARTDGRTTGVAPSTSVLRGSDLATAPGFTADDALRQTPGFSLFRRSSSRVANPTTHGVTLRGLSASGASRTLVLVEGVPLNDAFGGWVSWNRVPLAAIDRIEVVRGSASDLYGPDALGGVIQLFTVTPPRNLLRVYADAAGQKTMRGSLAAGLRRGDWHVLAALEAATSDGYVLVSKENRGPIDQRAGGTSQSGLLSIAGDAAGWLVEMGGDVIAEHRDNGTPFQQNSTAARLAHAGVSRGVFGGFARVRGFVGTQGYDQTFSAVNAVRTAETPTTAQYVPSETLGISADWAAGTRVRLLAGIEERSVRATNVETRYVGGVPSTMTRLGGHQTFTGGFGQVAFDPVPDMSVLLGARVERWAVDSFQGDVIDDEALFAPRLAVGWRASSAVSVQASVSRSFRAPTLNERFRGFRVGDTQTRPNATLRPERLTAFEAGVALSHGPTVVRATAFFNALDEAVTNLTISTTPTLTTRERRNAGSIDAHGVELEGSVRLIGHLQASAAASLVRSTFGDDAPAGLPGNRTPQSPNTHLAAELRWDALPAFGATFRLQTIGTQFEDDRNTLVLNRGTTIDIMVSRSLARSCLAFVAVENVFDNDIDVGRTPLRTVGSPRLARAGIRLTLP